VVEARVGPTGSQRAAEPLIVRARHEGVVVYAVAAAALAVLALALGKDVNWDLQNYHAYAPWALLHGGYARDVLAGNWQAYLNPIVFLVRYPLATALSPRAASVALAAVQALNVPVVYVVASRLFAREPRRVRIALACLSAGIGGLSAIFLSQIGTSFSDLLVSIPTLAAIALILPRGGEDAGRTTTRRLAFAGLAMGFSVGLKLTNYFFALALAVAVALGWTSWRERVRALVSVGVGGAVGAVAAALPWALRMEQDFGNPLFPLFGRGETILTDARDVRFQPTGVLHALTYPWRWATGVAVTTEVPFTDVRVLALLALVALVAVDGAMRRRGGRDVGAGRLAAFLASGAVFWLLSSGLHRHAMALDLLVGPAIVLCWRRLLPARPAVVASAALAAVALVTVRPPDWGRQAWTSTWFDVTFPEALQSPATVVLIPRSGAPLGFLAERFPEGSTFVQSGFPTFVPPGSVLDHRAHAILAAAPAGRTFVVADAAPDAETRRVVRGLGFALETPCLPIHTSLREMTACPLVRWSGATSDGLLLPDTWWSPGDDDGAVLLDEGWSEAEAWGRWAVGPRSTLRLRPAPRGTAPSVLELVGHAFVGDALPPLTVDVVVDGRPATRWRLAGDADRAEATRSVCFPAGGDSVTVELRADAPRSPASVGQSADARPLTFGLRRLRLRAAAAGECGA
jgi:hypothetical protein